MYQNLDKSKNLCKIKSLLTFDTEIDLLRSTEPQGVLSLTNIFAGVGAGQPGDLKPFTVTNSVIIARHPPLYLCWWVGGHSTV